MQINTRGGGFLVFLQITVIDKLDVLYEFKNCSHNYDVHILNIFSSFDCFICYGNIPLNYG